MKQNKKNQKDAIAARLQITCNDIAEFFFRAANAIGKYREAHTLRQIECPYQNDSDIYGNCYEHETCKECLEDYYRK